VTRSFARPRAWTAQAVLPKPSGPGHDAAVSRGDSGEGNFAKIPAAPGQAGDSTDLDASGADRSAAHHGAASNRAPTDHYQFIWRGITIRASYERDFIGREGEPHHRALLEVQSGYLHQPLPMTETGYRSLIIPASEIEHGGGVIAYVTRWLDAASRRPILASVT